MKGKDTKGHRLYDSIDVNCPRIAKSIAMESRLVMVRIGGRERKVGSGCVMGTRLPFGVMRVLCAQVVVMVAQHYECTKCH